jgi:outer membrane protein OmpA-like peptidoglycan-associated protein
VTTPPPKGTPSAGFDLRIETRLPPDGVPKLELDPGKRHEIVVHMPGGEAPGATVPQHGVAPAGMALPKVGEKWSTSAPTGQGRAAIVVPLPAARGVTPQLAIAYSTTGGNGPFGWGWRGSVPYFERTTTKAILREHGRGVPEYDDANESDVLAFSDADELVKTGEGIDPSSGAVVVRYAARTEGGFARIERHEVAGRSHFVVHDGGGTVSIFGLADEAVVADPNDPKRVFRWLLQQQRDVLGNVAVYRYQAEDDVGATAPAETGWNGTQPQRYLRRILYGNRDVAPDKPIDPTSLDDEAARARFMFEVVLDYGQHAAGAAARADDADPWPMRADPFGSGRAGFPIRTRRLCRRVLVFHRFAQLAADAAPVLTRIVELGYDEEAAGSRLVSVALTGVGEESSITLPARRFTYAPRAITADVRTIAHADTGGLDLSLPGIDAELFDLHGDGDAGLLTREHGRFVFRPRTRTGFGEGAPIPFAATPSTDPAVHVQRWLDTGGGLPSLVEFGPSDATVFGRDAQQNWFAAQVGGGNTPPVGKDPIAERHRIYLADLDGDGIADVLVASEGKSTWWRRMGAEPGDGWAEQPPFEHGGDEARGPGPVLFDAARDLAPQGTPRTEAIVLADMTGDGLPDVVRVRADEIAYWPNLGRGRFGGKIVIGDGAGFAIDETCVRACDVDGLGCASLLLLQPSGGGTLWINEAGNRLVRGPSIATPPLHELALSSLGRVDGSPVASFVWAPKTATPDITIVDLARGAPWLLIGDDSGTGARTTIHYSTAAAHARRCADEGRPWRTRLPIALSVVDAVVALDLARGTRFSSSYRYAHGHWDPIERELRGFGFVEQRDTDDVTVPQQSAFQTNADDFTSAPTRTRSWFFVDAQVDLSDEYDRSDLQAVILPPPDLSAFTGDARREAARALRGVTLRSERTTDDGDPELAARPWVTTSHAWLVRSVHAKGSGRHASMLPLSEQTLTYTGDRTVTPDPRLVQTATLEHDDFGFATRTAVVTYPRRRAAPEPDPVAPRKVDPEPANNVLLRAIGFAFDTDKSFVLPGALPGLAVIAAQCRAQTGGEVLVVGHTDRTGDTDANLGISLQRARRVVEYLRGDVDAWLLLFDASMPASIRWGAHEEGHMRAAIVDSGEAMTRRELVQRYMQLGGPPIATPLHAVGAGEGIVVDATDDGVSSAANRRIEAFFFAGAIDPPAPDKFVAADTPEYATWIARASQRADVDAATGAVVIEGGAVGRLDAEPRPAIADSRAPQDDPQRRTVILVAEVDLVHQQEADLHRLGTVIEQRSFEVTGKPGDPTAPLPVAALKAAASGGTEIPFEQAPSGAHERRLVARTRQSFYDDALSREAPLGVVGKRALPAKTRTLALSEAQATEVLTPMLADGEDAAKLLEAAGYL